LFRAVDEYLDERPPGLVVVDSVYNYHPSGQDVQVSNVYDRGPMFARQSDLIYRVCGQRSVLWLVDHFKSTGNGQLDLDSISQSGMAEFADTWWLQGHRPSMRSDPDKGLFYLNTEIGSRQDWPGTAFELDWEIGTYSKELGEYVGDLSVTYRSKERQTHDVKEMVSGNKIRSFIMSYIELHDMEQTKTKIRVIAKEKLKVGNETFNLRWDELVDEKLIRAEKRKIDEGGVMKEREVWGINTSPQRIPGNRSGEPVRNRSRLVRGDRLRCCGSPGREPDRTRLPRRGRVRLI
jgi:hypothetical protein